MRFQDKVIVVTGAGAGIGQSVARATGQEGAKVIIVDVDEKSANQTLHHIQGNGGTASVVVADVSSSTDMERVANTTVQTYRGIDYLVSSAGIQTYGTVVDTEEEKWDRTININLKSVYLAARYCIPEMLKRGGGAIVNVASVQGLQSQPNVAAYSASKGGIIAMTRTMALDHAKDNIRVNSICPGSVDTPMLRSAAALFNPDKPSQAVKIGANSTLWDESHSQMKLLKRSYSYSAMLLHSSQVQPLSPMVG